MKKQTTPKDYYQMVKDGQVIATESRTEEEAKQQNAALAAAGLTSRWVKWDMRHDAGSSLCPCSPCTHCRQVNQKPEEIQ